MNCYTNPYFSICIIFMEVVTKHFFVVKQVPYIISIEACKTKSFSIGKTFQDNTDIYRKAYNLQLISNNENMIILQKKFAAPLGYKQKNR